MATSVERKRFATAVTKALDLVRTTCRPSGPERSAIGAKARTATWLMVVGAFATAVGATALAALSVARSDPAGTVVAVYMGVTGIAITPLILADIRGRADVRRTAHDTVKLVTARPGEAGVVDETDEMLVIDASAGDLRVTLPEPSRSHDRTLTFERIDRTDHDVVLDPLGRSLEPADAELHVVVADGAWRALEE